VVFLQLDRLRLNNARRDEEDELLIRGAHAAPFEQVAEGRDVAQQRHLRDVDRVLSLDHTTDDNRTAIGDQNLRSRLLGDQSGVPLDGSSEVWRGIFHIHVQEDGAFGGDLRNHR